MIITKYPEWVEAQLKIIDERIEAIYREYENVKLKPDEAMQLKQNLAKRIQPFVDENLIKKRLRKKTTKSMLML